MPYDVREKPDRFANPAMRWWTAIIYLVIGTLALVTWQIYEFVQWVQK